MRGVDRLRGARPRESHGRVQRPPSAAAAPARRLRTPDAVTIGLAAMIGAGAFTVWAPAAAVAGGGLLVGLLVAGFVALCNATSSAQLAAQYPTSGGAYVYGRERLGEWPGFLAGWGFVVGKTASCAAMAMAFAAYAVPAPLQKPVAVGAVVLLTAVNLVGITRTALLARVLVVVSLTALGVVVVLGLLGPAAPAPAPGPAVTPYGVLQSAGLLFFAFAGFARLATLGEEVVEPRRTIPRAIVLALTVVLVLYLLVAVAVLHALGPAGAAGSSAPLREVAQVAALGWPVAVVAAGAVTASLGALLALLTGVGRTTLAMARTGDLPRPLAHVHPRFQVPDRAQLALGAAVCVLVLALDLRGAVGFSSFGVLLYYLVANLAAVTQERAHRRYPRALAVAGAAACVVLVVTLPLGSVVGGVLVLVIGVAYRAVRLRVDRR